MKASELVKKLQDMIANNGDIEVLGLGHPGESGCEPDHIVCVDRGAFGLKSNGDKAIFIIY